MVEAVAVVEATKLPSPGNSKIRRILVRFGSKPSFVTKSIRFGRTELLFFLFESSQRDLQFGHGFRACLKKIKKLKIGKAHFVFDDMALA